MDHILYWNGVALELNRRDFTPAEAGGDGMAEQGGPTLSSRALAIAHLAMYDAHACAASTPELPAYLPWPAGRPPVLRADAAVAGAMHTVLRALYPNKAAFTDIALGLSGVGGVAAEESVAYGRAVAAAHLADRATDPSASSQGYVYSTARGAHRPDPANPGQGAHAPFYGARSRLFAAPMRYELSPPPALGDALYLSALRQVRVKGIAPELVGTPGPADVSRRSVDESLVGIYWAYDGAKGLGTPPRLYNQIVREIAINRNNTADDNARLFALVNAAMGDAGILAWDQKYLHNLWRPVVGVREHDTSMGPAAVAKSDISDDCDPNWLPLGAPASNDRTKANFTPNFPAYPSGHATFGAAAFHVTRLFYNPSIGKTEPDDLFAGHHFVSDECNGSTQDNRGVVRPRHERSFGSGGLMQMIEENGFSRIYLGVHWSYDAFALGHKGEPDLLQNVGGVPLGLDIAAGIFNASPKHVPVRSSVGPRSGV